MSPANSQEGEILHIRLASLEIECSFCFKNNKLCKDREGLIEGNIILRLVIIVIHHRMLVIVSMAVLKVLDLA